MRLTGHKSPAMFMHYQAQWVGDDLRAAVDDARARRDEATGRAEDPAAGGPEAEGQAGIPVGEGDVAAVCNTTATPRKAPRNGARRRNPWAERDSNPRPFACKAGPGEHLSPASARPEGGDPGEIGRAQASVGATRRDRILGRLEPVVSRVAGWADEDPAAMRRLLVDDEFRRHLLAALDDVVGPASTDGASERGAG